MASFNAYPATRIQMPNFAQALSQAQQIKGAQQQQRFREMQMDQMNRQADREQRIREVRARDIKSGGASDELMAADPDAAVKLDEGLQKRQAFRHYSFARAVERATTPDEVAALALRAGRTPEQAQQAAANFAADPDAYRQEAAMGALSIKEQFGQRNADRTHERGVIESDRSHGLGQFNARTSRMNAEKKAPGFGLTVGPDGTIQFTQGIGPGELTSKTKGGLEDEAIESIKGLDRLKAAGETFDREFLTLGGKVSAAITAGKEKLGFETSDADREKLTRYTEFKRAALANLNEYINRITGAAVGADEAPRLIAAMPSAGQGLFDGDSPTEFKAKYNAVVKDLERAAARSIYARRNGISYESIPLARMDSIMKDRAAQLRDLVKAEDPTRSKEEIDAEARRRFRAEFGG